MLSVSATEARLDVPELLTGAVVGRRSAPQVIYSTSAEYVNLSSIFGAGLQARTISGAFAQIDTRTVRRFTSSSSSLALVVHRAAAHVADSIRKVSSIFPHRQEAIPNRMRLLPRNLVPDVRALTRGVSHCTSS